MGMSHNGRVLLNKKLKSLSPIVFDVRSIVFDPGDEAAARATYSWFPVLQPSDIADAVEFILRAPAHVEYHDLLLRPTQQAS